MTLVRDWLDAMEEERVDQLGRTLDAELARHGVREEARTRLGELIEGVWWSGGDGEGGRDEVVAVIDEVVPAVSGTTTEPLLALYIRVVCEIAWDLTWDHGPLAQVLGAAERAWSAHPPPPGSEAELALRTMLALRHELWVESACATGDLHTVRRVSARARDALAHDASAAGSAGSAREAVGSGGTTDGHPLRAHMVELLQDRHLYVDAVHVAAAAAVDFLEGRGDDLDLALDTLETAEGGVGEDHPSRSELRAHRVALQRLAAARSEDWLRVDDGSVVCVFPFGLRHADQAEVVATVKAHAATWRLAGTALANNPTGLLLVDDMWRGDDPLQRRYEGTQLDLPDLELLGRGGEPLRARVSIVVSQLGNHYVRVELPVREALPHTLASLVWAAAPEHGALTEIGQCLTLDADRHHCTADATDPEHGPWPRLSDLVRSVLLGVEREVRAAGLDAVSLSFRPGMYHVVTTVREASVLPGGRAAEAVPLEDAARLPQLFGSQSVCHPIPAGVGSVAFWARYAAPLGRVVGCAGLTDEYLLVSENHTLLASFSSPDYMVATVGQAAEFVASLEGMFAAWQDELSDFYLGLAPHLRRLDEERTRQAVATRDESDRRPWPPWRRTRRTEPTVDLEGVLDELELAQLRLRQFLTSARVSLLFISSPALVTSPVMRDTVNQLLELNRVWGQRADFTDVAGQALTDRLNDLIEAWSRRRAEEREERNRVRIDTMLAVLAGIGISGVLAMVQTGFDLEQVGSTVLVLLVLLLAVLVGVASYRWSRRGDAGDPTGTGAPPGAGTSG